jgi:small subunit ribosomal protein S4
MIRKKKLYLRPMKMFEASRIAEENELKKKYGLKNKKEIWKTLAKVNYFRHRAKALAKESPEEQEVLFGKLRELGLKIDSIADILDLKLENLLDRRLTTIVVKKGLANTPRHARQLVTHKKVLVNGRALSSPSYLVSVSEENKITIKTKDKKPKQKAESEETAEPAEETGGEE